MAEGALLDFLHEAEGFGGAQRLAAFFEPHFFLEGFENGFLERVIAARGLDVRQIWRLSVSWQNPAAISSGRMMHNPRTSQAGANEIIGNGMKERNDTRFVSRVAMLGNMAFLGLARFLEMRRKRHPVSKGFRWSQAGLAGKAEYDAAPLEMRIKDGFRHGQSAARLQGVLDLFQRLDPVRDLAQDGYEKRGVKAVVAQHSLPQSGMQEFNV